MSKNKKIKKDPTIYKLNLFTATGSEEDDEQEREVFYDTALYIDVDLIAGFYTPLSTPGLPPCITIFFQGDLFNVVQEDHIVDFLTKKFVDKAIDAEEYIKNNLDKK